MSKQSKVKKGVKKPTLGVIGANYSSKVSEKNESELTGIHSPNIVLSSKQPSPTARKLSKHVNNKSFDQNQGFKSQAHKYLINSQALEEGRHEKGKHFSHASQDMRYSTQR